MSDDENEIETKPHYFSFLNSTDECRSRTTSILNEQTIDYNVSPSVIVSPTINENVETPNDTSPLFSLRQVYKNLIIVSIAFTLLFTAYSDIIAIQSSLNAKGNVGVNSLIVLNVFALVSVTNKTTCCYPLKIFQISSLFLTGIATDVFGLKWTLVIAVIVYMVYIIANVKPEPYIMYTGSFDFLHNRKLFDCFHFLAAALVGLSSAPLWTAQAHYLGCLARDYAKHKNKKADIIVSLFFGIFFACFGTSGVWGNLISYFILNQRNNPQVNNCGVYFDPLAQTSTNSEPDVTSLTVIGDFHMNIHLPIVKYRDIYFAEYLLV